MLIKCHECDGYGLAGLLKNGIDCWKCKGTGKLKISRLDFVLLKMARKLKSLAEKYGW